MKIIGLTGFARCGKDTLANEFIRLSNSRIIKYSFATPLKELCRTAFLLSDEQLYGEEKEDIDERWGVSPRKILQTMGTNVFRESLSTFFPELKCVKEGEFWIHHFELWVKKQSEDGIIIIPDVRFKNEIDVIKKNNGIIIKIVRENKEAITGNSHKSEQELANYSGSINIENDGDYDKYIHTIQELYKTFDF